MCNAHDADDDYTPRYTNARITSAFSGVRLAMTEAQDALDDLVAELLPSNSIREFPSEE